MNDRSSTGEFAQRAPPWGLVAVAAGLPALLIGFAALVNGDTASLMLVGSLLIVPWAVQALMNSAADREPYASWAYVLLIAIQAANFRFRDPSDKSLDWQVILKLAGLGLFVIAAAPTIVREVRLFKLGHITNLTLVWSAFLFFLIATSAYSETPSYSFIAACSLFAGFIFLQHIALTRGRAGLVWVMTATTLALTCMSVLAYVFVPTFGRMSDWNNGAFVVTNRLQGVFGSANAAGASGAFGFLLLVLLGRGWNIWLKVLACIPMLICLIASDNRMAIVCTGLALAFAYILSARVALRTSVSLLAFGAALVSFAIFGEDLLALVARSGSADEVASATGRTQIWGVVIELWTQQPLFGYGYAAAQSVLPKHPMLFLAAAHAHNAYLEMLFSGGVVGLGLFLACIIATLLQAIRNRDRPAGALLLFFLVYGLTEPILSSLASLPALGLFSTALLAATPCSNTEQELFDGT